LLDPVGGGVAVDGDRRKKGCWPKKRPGFESGRPARTEALIIVNSHFRSMAWIKMASSLDALPGVSQHLDLNRHRNLNPPETG
jgi:hypothetical protein